MDNPQHSLDDALVEKVARAMALSDWPGNEWGIECFSEREQEEYRSRSRAALEAAGVAELREALEETMRRYPDARPALAWFSAASGLAAGEITQEVRDWASAALNPRQNEEEGE